MSSFTTLPTDPLKSSDDGYGYNPSSDSQEYIDVNEGEVFTGRTATLVAFLALIFGKPAVSKFRIKVGLIAACCVSFLILSLLLSLTTSVSSSTLSPSPSPLLSFLCISPRSASGLVGIFLFPLLHTSFLTALIDLFPFVILSSLLLLRPGGISTFFCLSVFYTFFGGFFVWLVGRSGISHTGCGGLLFAYFGFIVTFGTVKRDARSMLTAALTFVCYSSLIWGLFGNGVDTSISWESHVAGLAVGVAYGIWEATCSFDEIRDELTTKSKWRLGLWMSSAYESISGKGKSQFTKPSNSNAAATGPDPSKSKVYKAEVNERTRLTAEEVEEEV